MSIFLKFCLSGLESREVVSLYILMCLPVPFSYLFPETHLAKDCVEEYLNIHPKVKTNYEKMMKKYEEKALKEEKKKKRANKHTTR